MEISVPDLGDVSDVEISDILVKVGDRVSPEDPLVSLETEKATIDVPSPAAGSVVEIKVSVGDRVSVGDVLMILDGDARDDAGEGADAASEASPRDDGAGQPAAAASAPFAGESGPPRGRDGDVPLRPVVVPDLGDFSNVEVIDVLVSEGDEVEAEQGLITLETEKASMDVPAPEPGVVVALEVKVGDRVSAGDTILLLRPSLASPAAEAAAAPATRQDT
nr:hypothetical protein [Gammaproteobacteria bacterium]